MANKTGAERFYEDDYDEFLVLGSDVVGTPVGQEGARKRVFRFAEAYKDSCTAALEARIGQLESMYRAKDIIAANLAGKLEKAEAEVRELKAQLEQISQDGPVTCGGGTVRDE